MKADENLRWWVVSLFAAGLVLLVSFYLDARVQTWMTNHQTTETKGLMRHVSRIGDWPAHIVAGLGAAMIAYWRGSKKWMRIFVAMIVAFALAGTVSRGIKISTGRSRPDVQAEAGWNGLRFSSRYNAFPSGHTATSAAFFGTLAITSCRIGLPLLVIPLLIAFSRMYVGAHHLSDVVAGAVIGLAIAYLVSRWIPPNCGNSETKNQT